jgi:hypothetical protein
MSKVRIHRNLNGNASNGWVITPKGGKPYRVSEAKMLIFSTKISAPTLERIRTKKGDLTSRGSQGLGKRTVGAWLVGEVLEPVPNSPHIWGRENGDTIHFNPFKDDEFQIQHKGNFYPYTGGGILHFKPCGGVAKLS